MVSRTCILLFFLALLSVFPATTTNKSKQHNYKPCKELVLYFHDVIYNGKIQDDATYTIVAAPPGANLTILAGNFHFGNIAVFDDPITLDYNFYSTPVGRAQGMYMCNTKNTYTAWLGFSFVLNSMDYEGSINFVGADPLMMQTRDIYAVGESEISSCTVILPL